MEKDNFSQPLVQFQQPLNILDVPVAEGIPAPPVAGTPAPGETPAAEEEAFFVLPVGGERVCQGVTAALEQPLDVLSSGQQYVAFEPAAAAERDEGMLAFRVGREQVPASVELEVDGNVAAAGCEEGTGECRELAIPLGAFAAEGAAAGGLVYRQPLRIEVGTQVGSEFEPHTRAELATAFQIAEE